jgi:hypothetical protein
LALSDEGSLVTARTENLLLSSFKIALASPPPCEPVAPNTVISFFSLIDLILRRLMLNYMLVVIQMIRNDIHSLLKRSTNFYIIIWFPKNYSSENI